MRMNVWRSAVGPAVTVVVAGALWLLDTFGLTVPAPGGIVLLTVAYSTWVCGLVPGYASAALFLAAAIPVPLGNTHFLMLTNNPVALIVTMIAFALALPPTVTWLRARADRRLEAERCTRERVEAASHELRILQAALDHVDYGVILLDEQLHARFINQASRQMWNIPAALADARPCFGDLMRNACRPGVLASVPSDVEAHVEQRMAELRAGDETTRNLSLADGVIVRSRCKVLPGGGRFLSYGDVTDLVRNAEEFERLATTDEMTGLLNRRHFMSLARGPWDRFEARGEPLSLMIVDLDLFKSINDRFGHDAGDEVIRHVANVLETGRREPDVLARLGGEEFVLLLPNASGADAAARAEELRRRIEAAPLAIDNAILRISASIGVAQAEAGMGRFTDLMKCADKALYEAKRGGRNRVRLSKPAAEAGSTVAA
jgi:diguanylate cyclase (GGDEF)-like protein